MNKHIREGFIYNDKYRFIRLMAKTGTSHVWEAENLSIGSRVAIKVMDNNALQVEKSQKDKLSREASLIAKIQHPNMCAVYDVQNFEGIELFIMEHLQGISLEELIHYLKINQIKLDMKDVLYIIIAAARGLAAAHECDEGVILHRDIKPANIFITKNGFVKILDLGVGKILSPDNPYSKVEDGYTINYTDPLLWQDEKYNIDLYGVENDVFCLGLVFYELVVGSTLFSCNDLYQLMMGEYRTFPSENYFPVELLSTVRRWLSFNRNERFASFKELINELRKTNCSDEASVSKIVKDFDGFDAYAISQTVINHRKTLYISNDKVASVDAPSKVQINFYRPKNLIALANKGEYSDVDLSSFQSPFPFPDLSAVCEDYQNKSYEEISESTHQFFKILFINQIRFLSQEFIVFDLDNMMLLQNLLKHLKKRANSRLIAFSILLSERSDIASLKKWLFDNRNNFTYGQYLESKELFGQKIVDVYVKNCSEKKIRISVARFFSELIDCGHDGIPKRAILERIRHLLMRKLEMITSLNSKSFELVLQNQFAISKSGQLTTEGHKSFCQYFKDSKIQNVIVQNRDIFRTVLDRHFGELPEFPTLGITDHQIIDSYYDFVGVDILSVLLSKIKVEFSPLVDESNSKLLRTRLDVIRPLSRYMKRAKLFVNRKLFVDIHIPTNHYFVVENSELDQLYLVVEFGEFYIGGCLWGSDWNCRLSYSRKQAPHFSNLFDLSYFSTNDLSRISLKRDYAIKQTPDWQWIVLNFLKREHQLQGLSLPNFYNSGVCEDDVFVKDY